MVGGYVEAASDISDDATTSQPTDDWTLFEGRSVDVYENGELIDRGRIDAVTNDGRFLWLAQEGIRLRRLVEKLPGTELMIIPAHRLP